MKILVLGGTQFVGRHIVEALHGAGHAVSILTRGVTKDALPASVERLRGDRDLGAPGLDALSGRSWDACVDVSGYTPRQVRASAESLHSFVGRYAYVSAVSVYGDPVERPVREDQALAAPAAEDVTEVNGETYGPLKVACENIVRETYGEASAVLRPQIVVGPYDPTPRYAYWVRRAMQGGKMLAPGDGTDHLQIIDVRDLGRFAVKVLEDELAGAFNLAGPRFTWSEFMKLLGAKDPVWVDAGILAVAKLSFLELGLFRPEYGPRSSLMDVSNERALKAGLVLTKPAVTAQDARVWSLASDLSGALSPERESALMALAGQRRR